MRDPKIAKLVRIFVLELSVYAVLVVTYFLVVLRFLGNWLTEIFKNNLVFYAVLALGLVVVQGVFLEFVTAFLLDVLKVERLD